MPVWDSFWGNLLVRGRALIGSSRANRVQVDGAAASANPAISAVGSDTDVSLDLVPKGAGSVNVKGAKADFGTSLANYVEAAGAASLANPAVKALGTDTDISLDVASKGAGTVNLKAQKA